MGRKFELGQVVSSTSGRDREKVYLVVGFDEKWILVADGISRKLQKPKRKNPLHLRKRKARSKQLGEKIAGCEKVTNQDVRGYLSTLLELENNTTPSRGGEE